MFTRPLRTLAAALLALSLALPAAPALADAPRRGPSPEAIATVLGGLALVYLLKERRDERREEERARERRAERAAKPEPPRRAKVAPAACRREVRARNGHRIGYGARCMQARCLRRERGRAGLHYYGPGCLRNEGWQVARR
ncbi:hypothetical protein JQC91_04950 [Jannaschia sp. Os4]|uniref:hypothetical protein n=1 Tax=Jannaschia sp. Os4 TaxID=2807617 RepID=UPI00193A7DB5|nr:hypothetical protein [Jannaschia sp. Os4]MBM2575646.1 hypothetical protein [Jannaschia sp. Os4]